MDAGKPSGICQTDASPTLDDPRFQAIRDALAAVRSHAAPTRTTSHATWEDDRGMNERVKRLRHQSETTQPYLDMERALIETATYLRYEGTVSIPELRGLVLRDYFAHKSISIEPGELIVGEKGRGPQAAPTFPELCCHTLEDMHNMNDREQVNFTVTEDDLAAQRDIVIPYWTGRASRDAIMRAQEPAWHDAYEAGIFTEFYEQRAGGHTCLGSERGVRAGFGEIRADIEASLAGLDYLADEHAVAKRDELSGMLIALEGVQMLAIRYAELASAMAADEPDPVRAAELSQIAENCRVVATERPQTFWQWIQRYWFIHLAITSETNPWDAYTPGRLDQHLIGHYRADVASGALDRDRALELLECLWVKFNNQPAPPKVGVTLKESGTYSDFANINTGGITPDGADGVNEVSYLILDCMDEMMFIQPNSNVQISRKTPRRFLLRACEVARAGWGQPAFYSTEEIVDELLAAGKSLADARRGGSSGCVETGCWGYEAYPLTGYFNLPKILEVTLHNGVDPRTGKLIGLTTGDPRDFASYDELFDAYCAQMRHFIDIKVRGSNINTQLCARLNPVPFMSIMTEDCIARGQEHHLPAGRGHRLHHRRAGVAAPQRVRRAPGVDGRDDGCARRQLRGRALRGAARHGEPPHAQVRQRRRLRRRHHALGVRVLPRRGDRAPQHAPRRVARRHAAHHLPHLFRRGHGRVPVGTPGGRAGLRRHLAGARGGRERPDCRDRVVRQDGPRVHGRHAAEPEVRDGGHRGRARPGEPGRPRAHLLRYGRAPYPVQHHRSCHAARRARASGELPRPHRARGGLLREVVQPGPRAARRDHQPHGAGVLAALGRR